jgi:hypothetical protein
MRLDENAPIGHVNEPCGWVFMPMKICQQELSIHLSFIPTSLSQRMRTTTRGLFALLLRCLRSLFPITLNHNHAQKASHHGTA